MTHLRVVDTPAAEPFTASYQTWVDVSFDADGNPVGIVLHLTDIRANHLQVITTTGLDTELLWGDGEALSSQGRWCHRVVASVEPEDLEWLPVSVA